MIKSNDHFIHCLVFIAFWILNFKMYNLILEHKFVKGPHSGGHWFKLLKCRLL